LLYLILNRGNLKDKLYQKEIADLKNLTSLSFVSEATSSSVHKTPSFDDGGVNYYIKSSLIMDVNIVSVFNFIVDYKSHINWKKYLFKVNKSDTNNNSFNYLYKYDDDEFAIDGLTIEYIKKDRSLVIIELKDNNKIINIYTLEADSSWNKTRVTCFSAVNNSLPFYYFQSVFKQLKHLNAYINYTIIDYVCFGNKENDIKEFNFLKSASLSDDSLSVMTKANDNQFKEISCLKVDLNKNFLDSLVKKLDLGNIIYFTLLLLLQLKITCLKVSRRMVTSLTKL